MNASQQRPNMDISPLDQVLSIQNFEIVGNEVVLRPPVPRSELGGINQHDVTREAVARNKPDPKQCGTQERP